MTDYDRDTEADNLLDDFLACADDADISAFLENNMGYNPFNKE